MTCNLLEMRFRYSSGLPESEFTKLSGHRLENVAAELLAGDP